MLVDEPEDILADLSSVTASEIVRCARTLLRHPLLRAAGPEREVLAAAYKHREVLRLLFSRHLGYRLTVDRQFARLFKTPLAAPGRGGAGLTPRGYTYLYLTMAVLIGTGRRTLITRLVADIRGAAAEAGIVVDDSLIELRAMTAALKYLLGLGILTELDGVVAPWSQGVTPEALLAVDTDLLGFLLAGPIPPGDDPAAIIAAAAGASAGSAAQAVRRRLVEDPVVLFADLPADQAEYLRRHHRREGYLLERYFGLVAEVRAEGMLASDPEAYLTDMRLPGMSAPVRAALLMLPELLVGADPRGQDGRYPVTAARVREVCAGLVAAHPAAWSKTGNAEELADKALKALCDAGLACQHTASVWLISPAAHRYAPTADGPGAADASESAAVPAAEALFTMDDDEDEDA